MVQRGLSKRTLVFHTSTYSQNWKLHAGLPDTHHKENNHKESWSSTKPHYLRGLRRSVPSTRPNHDEKIISNCSNNFCSFFTTPLNTSSYVVSNKTDYKGLVWVSDLKINCVRQRKWHRMKQNTCVFPQCLNEWLHW